MTPKDSTGMTLYVLVYGKEIKMPINLELNALTYAVNTEDAKDNTPMQKRLNQLLILEESNKVKFCIKLPRDNKVSKNILIGVQS